MGEFSHLNFLGAFWHGISSSLNGPRDSAAEPTGWEEDQPHPVQDVAQGSVPPGQAVGTCDTHPIPWLGSSSSALLQPLQLLRDEEQTLHSLAQGSAPGVWHQRPCSVIPDHGVVAHPANNPAEIKTKRFSMRFK